MTECLSWWGNILWWSEKIGWVQLLVKRIKYPKQILIKACENLEYIYIVQKHD